MSLTPRGMSIQEAYRLYADKTLTVNRSYQRKLVWSEIEKQHLIDSIERELPIPLFMFAKFGDEDSFEIIDGMQRLNAIFSFIEHQFVDEAGRCFDLEQSSRAKLVMESGVFKEFPDDIPRLSAENCAKFLEYQLAVTIDSDSDENRINEVFGRINSGGRQLSPQEQRQAGLVSDFSEFVRRVAFELRGDSSPDVLRLNEMPEVSFNTPRERQRYGIDAIDIFWCKHGIMSAKDLARSLDEQMIADIAISILKSAPLNTSREVLDTYFEATSKEFEALNISLSKYSSEKLRNEILATIGAIKTVFETGGFHSFRNCVHEQPRNPARTTFFAVFISFHELMFKDGMYPEDLTKIRSCLENVRNNMISSAHHTTTEDRLRNISVVKGLIRDAFVKRDVAAFGSAHQLVVELENSLRRSRFEASRYEFKLGICSLGGTPTLDSGMYKKLARTACAIANTNPGQDGYIYIGVADNLEAANRVEYLFSIAPIKIGDVFFVGLDHELEILKTNFESYVRKMISELARYPISDPLKTQIMTTIDHAEYEGRPFIRLRIPAQVELSAFDGQFPIRKNSDTVDLTPVEVVAQAKLFDANKGR